MPAWRCATNLNLDYEYLIPVAVGIVAGVVLAPLRLRRMDRMIRRWAAANDVTYVRRHWPLFRLGPWPIRFGKQVVVYITVRDGIGEYHRCWLKLGHPVWGLLSDAVEERWET
jgi:hypothetical protein